MVVHWNHIFVDASSKKLGAIWQKEVHGVPIIPVLRETCNIVHFEATNILLAMHIWAARLDNQECTIWCDNKAVVHAFTFDKIKDNFLLLCVHSVWLLCAQ